MIALCTLKIVIKKKFTFFFSASIRMSRKNVNFGDKNINKSDFYKNKKVTKIDDIDVKTIFVSKEEQYVQKIHSNTLSDTMTMILLDHYP